MRDLRPLWLPRAMGLVQRVFFNVLLATFVHVRVPVAVHVAIGAAIPIEQQGSQGGWLLFVLWHTRVLHAGTHVLYTRAQKSAALVWC